MIRLDINARIIPERSRIWALHAGVNKKYFNKFLDYEKIFLDLPSLSLERDDNLKTPLLRRKIQRSLAWRDYFDSVRKGERDEKGNLVAPPSSDLDQYSGDQRFRYITNVHASVAAVFFTAQVGDLIVAPSSGGQFGEVRFAEVVEDFDPNQHLRIEDDPKYSVQYRAGKWLDAYCKRRDVSEALAKRLGNRRAVIEIDRGKFGLEIYSIVYPNFATDSVSKTTLFGPSYRSKDARDIVSAIKIISWLIAAFEACQAGRVEELNALTIDDAIAKFYRKNIVRNFQIEFSSPGTFRLWANNKAMAIFVAGAVAVAPMLSGDAASGLGLQITNSRAVPSDPDEREGTIALEGLIKSLAPFKRKEISDLAGEAQQKIGLRSDARVEKSSMDESAFGHVLK